MTHNVLFVCEFGSKKSLVAAQHFNRAAAEAGIVARATSRGGWTCNQSLDPLSQHRVHRKPWTHFSSYLHL